MQSVNNRAYLQGGTTVLTPSPDARSGRYQLSFTFGGLLIPETLTIAEAYQDLQEWPAVRRRMIDENGLQKTRRRTAQRYVREIKVRLEHAYPWERELIVGDSPEDRAVVLYAVFTRYYLLVGDFVTQVVRERYLSGLATVDTAMFRTFMADQAPAHPELSGVSDTTAAKLAEVALRVMREASLLSGGRAPFRITPPSVSAEVRRKYCLQGNMEDLAHFLWSDKEIAPCLQ